MTTILEAPTAQYSDTPATPVFAAPIRHPSAWTVADFRSPADYSVDLDAAQLRDIAAAVRRIKAAGVGLDRLQREHFEVPSLRLVAEAISARWLLWRLLPRLLRIRLLLSDRIRDHVVLLITTGRLGS